ncbi:MAG: type I methionyl aminopeptidase [Bacteroidota bacterium]|nr:type I methionyl aminopeptidase [Bacteroidota bacterium]MDX5426614.1 type I methionyl aminopeptidase [Bacteroidota bacterium]MDX5447100.1 type I methionyl aminopeptidase [Bacteroidota bacterium]MDX5504623.1 type I methionyl aminopeptidase [Bacteroidota bacterium]
MIIYKTREEIEIMRESAQLVSRTLGMLAKEIKPGVTPLQLDRLAEEFLRDHGGVPGFLGFGGFPNTLCTSVNEMVVHGIPNDRALQEGDIISVDCGVVLNGYYGDHAYTFEVGEVDPKVHQLLEVTKESLYLGIEQMKVGNRLEDIGFAIQQHAEKHGYGVVRELVGHGIGKTMHEDPQVPNYGKKGRGKKLQEGLVLAIEPMINLGTHRVKQLRDGWSIVTSDGLPSAHFEHDVAIVDGKPDILSTFDYIYEALGIEAREYEKTKAL